MAIPKLWHVRYVDGTYGEALARDEDDAVDQLARDDLEMDHGAVRGSAPKRATVSISNFGSER